MAAALVRKAVSVFAKDPNTGQVTSSVTMDTAITEQHTLENEVTDHPVEEGFNVTDHSRPKPERIVLDCIVSNTPLSTSQQRRVVQSGAVKFTTTSQPSAAEGYADLAYKQLLAWRNNGTLLTVASTLRVASYDSMLIESITIPRDTKTLDALRFTLTVKRIRVVQNKLTRVKVAKDPRAGAKVSTGNQVPQDPAQDSSVLYDGADAASKSSNPTIGAVGKALLKLKG